MPNRRTVEDGTDDTEGNKFRGSVSDGVDDDSDDTEGNKFRGSVSDGVDDDSDDTEGHGRVKNIITDGVEDDDTEGNRFTGGRTIPPSANPNKGAKPRP